MNKKLPIFASISALFSFSAHADLPLTVENLLSDKGKIRLDISTTYVNSERRGIDAADPIALQISNTTAIEIPSTIGENYTNTDVLLISLGARYGLTEKDEIYTRISGISIDSRAESATGNFFKDTDTRVSDLWIGINHKFRDDIDKPALFGFIEAQVAEKQPDGETIKGKSFVLGMTTYQTYDPIVLSLTGSLQINTKYSIDGIEYKNGNSFSLSPSVGFAVNDKVTLTTGLNWRMSKPGTVESKNTGLRRTRTTLDFGLGYAIGKKDTLNFSVQPQVSGDGDVQMNLNWIHHLEKKPAL